ncbi:MAG: hypothetical protein FJ039_10975 [Chloroflexi bacterium]|nr:hypothetical protein [Chloroflexota bacterium]
MRPFTSFYANGFWVLLLLVLASIVSLLVLATKIPGPKQTELRINQTAARMQRLANEQAKQLGELATYSETIDRHHASINKKIDEANARLDPDQGLSDLIVAMLMKDQWGSLDPSLPWEIVGDGSYRAGAVPRERRLSVGPAPNSWVLMRTSEDPAWGPDPTGMNWSRTVMLHGVFTLNPQGNFSYTLLFGTNNGDNASGLQRKGIGFAIVLNDFDHGIFGLAHDGKEITKVRLGDAVATLQTMRITAISRGNGQVEWYQNGIFAAKITEGGPTGPPINFGDQNIQATITNLGVHISEVSIHDVKVYVSQN